MQRQYSSSTKITWLDLEAAQALLKGVERVIYWTHEKGKKAALCFSERGKC